jgi:hypothetical protein
MNTMNGASTPGATAPDEVRPVAVPRAIRESLAPLFSGGEALLLTGESILQLAQGDLPSCFAALSEVSFTEAITRLPRAVPTGPSTGIITMPTSAGPVDIRTGCSLHDPKRMLAEGEYRVLSIAVDIQSEILLDPFDGLADLKARRLRTIDGRAPVGLSSLLSAARLVSRYQLAPSFEFRSGAKPDADSIAGSPGGKATCDLDEISTLKLRREVRGILTGSGVASALRLLRDSGVEQLLLPGAREDAADVAAALAPELVPRATAWMRGADARSLMRRGRFGVSFAHIVYRLLEHHPIDVDAPGVTGASIQRTFKRLSKSEIEILIELREAEILAMRTSGIQLEADEIEERLDRVKIDLDRWREKSAKKRSLCLDGREIMTALGCDAGPIVGRALKFLHECVENDPGCNNPASLQAHLHTWTRAQ